MKVIRIIDYVLTGIYVLEMIMKIIAFGFLFNGPESYLRVGWNILDFIVVVTSLISFLPHTTKNLSFFKVIRIFRIFRVL